MTFWVFCNNSGRSFGDLVSLVETRAGLLSWALTSAHVENNTFFLFLTLKVEREFCPEVALEDSVPTSLIMVLTPWMAFPAAYLPCPSLIQFLQNRPLLALSPEITWPQLAPLQVLRSSQHQQQALWFKKPGLLSPGTSDSSMKMEGALQRMTSWPYYDPKSLNLGLAQLKWHRALLLLSSTFRDPLQIILNFLHSYP